MRVLIIGPDLSDPGGVANYYNAVFPRLANETIQTQYLAIGSTRSGSRFAHIFKDQLCFWNTLNKFRPDIIHINPSLVPKSFLRDGAFILQAKFKKKPVIVFFRGWDVGFENYVSKTLKWYFDVTYRKADFIIVLAKQFKDRLNMWGVNSPIALGSTTVADELLNGFSIETKIDDIRNSNIIRVLYLARLEERKGIMDLLDAVENLYRLKLPINLTIAGDGPMRQKIEEKIALIDPTNTYLKFVGYARGSQKSELFKSHHIFCLPTQYDEGMPNSILEAMAFGLPVVTCPVGGIPDFFDSEKMGKLLKDNHSDLISSALQSLIFDRSTMAEMAKHNNEYAKTNFLASSCAAFLRNIYTHIIAAS